MIQDSDVDVSVFLSDFRDTQEQSSDTESRVGKWERSSLLELFLDGVEPWLNTAT